MGVVWAIIIGYLIGSISTSTLITRWRAHVDIRDHGSGNAGATNTLRLLGTRWAVIVLATDIAKGVVVVLIAQWLCGHAQWGTYLAGLSAIVGHNWPLWFRFRGGKGIATTIGVLLTLVPLPALCAGVVGVLLIILTRYVSLGALVFVILTAVLTAMMGRPTGVVVFASLIAALATYRHRTNIMRLVRGTESRVFTKM